MASASNNITIYAPASAVYGYLLAVSFEETSTSTTGNYSKVTCSAALSSNVIAYSQTGGGTLAVYWHDNNTNTDTLVASNTFDSCGMNYGTAFVSGSINATHKSDGTLKGYAKAVFTKNKTNSYIPPTSNVSTAETTLTNIPRQATVTSAPNFNDEENPTMKYNNSAGTSVTTLQVGIGNNDGSVMYAAYRDVSKTGTSYTFNLTTAERNALRNATTTSNTKTIGFWIKTVLGGHTYYHGLAKTLTIVNANPTFTSAQVTYKDTNASVVAITGNDQNIVRNNSTLQYKYTAASGNKGATISRYEISFNGTTTTKSTAATIDYGVLNASSNIDLVIKAIDTRGNSTSVTKSINVLDWVLPSATIELARVNNYEDDTNLKVNGSISYVDGKNAIQSIKYRYKKIEDASYSGYTTINDHTEYTIQFDKVYAWNIQIEITDKFGSTTYNLVLAKGMPIMFIDVDKLSVGVNCFPALNNSFELNGAAVMERSSIINLIYPVGSVYPTFDTTFNPNTTWGGTWVKLNEVFLYATNQNAQVGDTGGEATHKLTASEAAQKNLGTIKSTTESQTHTHNQNRLTGMNDASSYDVRLATNSGGVHFSADKQDYATGTESRNHTHNITIEGSDATTAHNNMPPYIKIIMWRRTA